MKACDACLDTTNNNYNTLALKDVKFNEVDCQLCHTNAIPLSIRSVNDAPEWIVPLAPITTESEVTFRFDGDVYIRDVDSFSSDLYVSIKVDYGVVSMPFLPPNLTLNGTGDNDRSLSMTGSLTALNWALRHLTYHPVYTLYTIYYRL